MSSIKIEIRTGDSALVVTDSNVEDRTYGSDGDLGLETLIDKTVDRVKKALDIEPGALENAKLGRAARDGFKFSREAYKALSDEELGAKIIEFMANPPERYKGRPIADSPQA